MNINLEKLKLLVKDRPVIWDKTAENYRNHRATDAAWDEICRHLDPNFHIWDENGKNEFRKRVKVKWTYTRDAFQRGLKRKRDPGDTPQAQSPQEAKRFESLKFLLKTYDHIHKDNGDYNYQNEEADQNAVYHHFLEESFIPKTVNQQKQVLPTSVRSETPNGETMNLPDHQKENGLKAFRMSSQKNQDEGQMISPSKVIKNQKGEISLNNTMIPTIQEKENNTIIGIYNGPSIEDPLKEEHMTQNVPENLENTYKPQSLDIKPIVPFIEIVDEAINLSDDDGTYEAPSSSQGEGQSVNSEDVLKDNVNISSNNVPGDLGLQIDNNNSTNNTPEDLELKNNLVASYFKTIEPVVQRFDIGHIFEFQGEVSQVIKRIMSQAKK